MNEKEYRRIKRSKGDTFWLFWIEKDDEEDEVHGFL